MAATPIYTIEPNPHWVIIDNFSKLPDGAAIYTYRSLNPSEFKPAFQDAAGMIPYGQPIVGFGNGTMPPIFWEFDPNNPTETYYIRVYDSADPTTQQFLWDFDGLSGGGAGGGGTIITATDLENLIVNNIFFRNSGTIAGSPSVPTFNLIAPSNNAGYVGNSTNTDGSPAPDITFQKNNTNASDEIDFLRFLPSGIQELRNDVTPQVYFKYICSDVGAAGETYKYLQFPICQGVQIISQQAVTVKIYARCNSGNTTLKVFWRQFYGDGGGSPDNIVQAGSDLTLTSSWQPFVFKDTIPSAMGTIGACGNDALFMQIELPLNAITNIDISKPAVYLGSVAPGIDFVSNDAVDSIINSPRTGDIRIGLNSFLPGWVIMNDGTIGDTASSSSLSSRANNDTFALFNLIWSLFNGSPALQALAPMYAAGTNTPIIPYGASAIADFIANRQISLTAEAGRVMAGVSASHLIGTIAGSETHTMSIAEMPAHNHPGSNVGSVDGAGGSANAVRQAATGAVSNVSVNVASQGGGAAFNIMQPTVFMNFFIKL